MKTSIYTSGIAQKIKHDSFVVFQIVNTLKMEHLVNYCEKHNRVLFSCCSLGIFVLFSLPLFGQIQKGDISLQGNLGLGYQWSAATAEGVSLPINPSVAFMASDNWLLGASLGANVLPGDDLGDDGIIQPFVRYYFNPESDRNNYFVGSSVNFIFSDGTQIDGGLSAGFNRFIASNLSLEATLGYAFGDTNPSNTVSAGLGLRSFLSNDNWQNRKSATSNLTQGSWLLGTSSVGLAVSGDFINLRISPNVGYFLTDRFVLGLNSGFSYASTIDNDSNEFNADGWSAQPFVRYYFPNQQGQRLVPFGQFGVGYASSNSSSENLFDINLNRWSTHASIGANLFLAPNVAFEFSLDLRRSFDSNAVYDYNEEIYSEDNFPDFDGTLNDRELELGLNMGIQFFLFRK